MSILSKLFRPKSPPQPSASSLQKGQDGVYLIRISGVFDTNTLKRMQSVAISQFARGETDIRILIRLIDFKGWKIGDDWGDMDFFLQYESNIAKIAVVGDEAWRDQTLTFLGAGHRRGSVRFFPAQAESDARLWLASR